MSSNTHVLKSYLERCSDRCARSDGYSPDFLAEVTQQGSAWSREARLVIATAARLGIRLHEESLIWADVRDLQALHNVLVERLSASKAA
jgi:hypothetical protein